MRQSVEQSPGTVVTTMVEGQSESKSPRDVQKLAIDFHEAAFAVIIPWPHDWEDVRDADATGRNALQVQPRTFEAGST